MVKRILKIGIITVISLPFLVGGLVFLHLFVTGPYLEKLDDQANQAFAEKARHLHITGKTEAYVLEHFGQPAYTYLNTEGDTEILVYIPGPALAIWASECKIGVDNTSRIVTSWMINSD